MTEVMEFYSQDRFNNWVKRIEETEVKEDDPNTFEVFDQFVEDFAIACLNLLRSVKSREVTKKEALEMLENAKKFFLTSIDFGDELKNEFYDFIRESIKAIIQSTIFYLQGKFSKKDFDSLIKEAIDKEAKGDYRGAFEAVARIGAKVLKGEELPELEVPDGFVANWLDGIEAINFVIKVSEIDSEG
jgi:hypothetical protein